MIARTDDSHLASVPAALNHLHRLLLAAALLGATGLSAQSPASLEVRGPDGSVRTLGAAQLQTLPRVSGAASAHGNDFTFEGHDVRDVLRLAGVTPVDSLRSGQLRRVLVFVGADGYSALIALSDLDASIGGRRAILVDREDGRALPADRGPRRIIIEGDRRPSRWVRQVVRIEVRDLEDRPSPAPRATGDLLDHLVGDWVMTGTIGSERITHDVRVDRILGDRYVRLHELARDTTPDGEPAYEAWIHIAWDSANAEYVVMWLDNTGTTNFAEEGVGHGRPDGDAIPFVWRSTDGSGIRNTFAYERATDTWTWRIDNVSASQALTPFARVTLRRRP